MESGTCVATADLLSVESGVGAPEQSVNEYATRPNRVKMGKTMKRRKKAMVPTPEERAEHERRADAPGAQPDCRAARIDAELMGHKPGATGLTVRSSRPRC